MNAPDKPRWHYRFASFTNALEKLREIAARRSSDYAVQIGLVQLFNITFELAWKLLKERMQSEGINTAPVFPRAIIKKAFAAQLITDGEAWMAMLENRNIIAHQYDEKKFRAAVDAVYDNHLPAFNRLYEQLRAEI